MTAWRRAFEDLLSAHSAVRQRLRRGQRVGIDSCDGLAAFLLLAALASNFLNWWARRQVWAGCAQPPLGLRQLIARVITVPARVLHTPHDQFLFLLPPAHPSARHLIPPSPGYQLPLPWVA
jgi:hypothetical protein